MRKYRRYLDDIFIIWNTKIDTLENFHKIINNLDTDLNFTNDSSGFKVNFLDVQLVINENKCIITDVFYKKTDSMQYLNFNSSHPRHVKQNIPYNLARRLCMIINNSKILEKRLEELKNALLSRKFPLNLIKYGIDKAMKIPKEDLLKNTTKEEEKNIIPLIQTFNPNYNNYFNEAKNAINSLERSNPNFKNNKFIKSYRQPMNLKRILTTEKSKRKSPIVEKCNDKKCNICKIIITKSEYNFNGIIFKVNRSMSCKTKNCIYVINCNGCNEIYIGETNNFRLRMNLHINHIKLCHCFFSANVL